MRIHNHMAILRNLRNVEQIGVSREHINKIKRALTSSEWTKGAGQILPFRYVSAARAAPSFEPELDQALINSLAEMPKLSGRTAVLVDVSGSMNARLSAKSDLTRMDAAAALAAMFPARRQDLSIYTFSYKTVMVPTRMGMAGVDAINASQIHGGTMLGQAVEEMGRLNLDRLVVITDEQSHTAVKSPGVPKAYMVNVASYQNGVGYDNGWTHIDGFSEHIFDFIREMESIDG